MKKLFLLAIMAIFLAGCAQPDVQLSQSFWQKKRHVKVAKVQPATAGLYQVGQEGLLDVAVNDIATKGFQDYLGKYHSEKLASLQGDFMRKLRANHMKVSTFRTVNPNNLLTDETRRPIAAQVGKNKLLVLSITQLGSTRRYYAFVPLDAPKAICVIKGELINVKTNKVLWRYTSQAIIPVDGNWDQPPRYPNFTRALNKAVTVSKSQLLDNFFSGRDAA